MKRKTTIRKMNENKGNFEALAGMELDLVPSFRVAKIIEAFNEVMETFDRERSKLFKRYFKVQPKNGQNGVYNEGYNEELLLEEVDALLEEEVEFEFNPIKKSKLTSGNKLIAIKPGILNGITWAFVEDLPDDALSDDLQA